jgi:2-succinyl-5-enolpyruvyl-6-hydroxy-3-cyclohexene-1-carboxylate synthase
LPEGATLFSGNSLPIRQLDGWSGGGDKPLRIFANRGASGIDGNHSTLFGIAAMAEQPVVGLLGDLACYHDMNGLLAARGRRGVIVLLNNGGGGIFGYLPQAGLEGFEQHWLTPTGLDFSHAATLYGLGYVRIEHQSAFRPALAQALAADRVTLIEVMLDREQSQLRQQQYWQTIAST